ncbi:MAG: DUF808 domain-containing protein [Alphaproteobacteria bacterium]|nr:DUF808 domain-containing protein [Alphaproteobacteria bacterium]
MAGGGLIALLDDVATIADDVATLTLLAAKKTTGVVTDDMAVTAEQAIGLAASRELPVVWKVARGSLFNKFVILAPGALVLNAVAPWSIHPILMAGGLFLSFEGVEKLLEKTGLHGHGDGDAHEPAAGSGADPTPLDPVAFEQQRVSGAIRTDLILSGEIVALTLAEVASYGLLTQVAVLYGVSVLLTVGVYGVVAVLVKVDDVGAAMVVRGGRMARVGRVVVASAPKLLHAISWIGTFAMLVVGGHILLDGIHPLAHAVEDGLHHVPPALRTVAGMGIDLAVGVVAGLGAVGVMATGALQALWRRTPWG